MGSLSAFRHWARRADHPLAAALRAARGAGRGFTLPSPRWLVRPYLWLFLGARGTLFFLRRTLVAEPLFKAYCTRVGRGVTTGIHVPWVCGSGELVVGDRVHVSGKLSLHFAASFVARPRLEIGDHSDIGHDVRFVVGRGIRLGRHVQVAGGTTFRDSGGHPVDPARRQAGSAPDADDVRPVLVHDNVWIGSNVLVMPGTEIGEGAIVSAQSVVSGKVAPYTVVAGNPARRIASLPPPPGREHLVPPPAAARPVAAATAPATPAPAAAPSAS